MKLPERPTRLLFFPGKGGVDKIMTTNGRNLAEEGGRPPRENFRSPCTGEVAAFHAFARIVAEARSDVVVLDGGLPKWIAEGRPLAEGPAHPPQRHFTARLNHALVAEKADLLAASRKAGAADAPQILDARGAGRFRGDEPETRPGLRADGFQPATRRLLLSAGTAIIVLSLLYYLGAL